MATLRDAADSVVGCRDSVQLLQLGQSDTVLSAQSITQLFGWQILRFFFSKVKVRFDDETRWWEK